MSFYRLSDLKRYNNMPRIKSESLAEHQYYCGLILMLLKDDIINVEYADFCMLLQYVLIHDIGELYTGDIPHNVKQDYPELKSLLEKIEIEHANQTGFTDVLNYVNKKDYLFKLFKLCDTIQVIQYCKNEINLGNTITNISRIYNHTLKIVESQINDLKNQHYLKETFNLKELLDKLC